jgi:CBS domain-containing protein
MYLRSGKGKGPSVVWTRGKGCAELAELIGGSDCPRVTGDLAEQCIDHRADLLVSRRLPGSFDLVSVAVPVDFNPENVTRVIATVAGGPHSLLAAETAGHLARALGVQGEMVFAAQPGEDHGLGLELLDQIGSQLPDLRRRIVEVEGVSELVDDLGEGALLVLGAPGGSWLQRAMLGPGARLRRTAQAGVVVVRTAPDRVFRFMEEPIYVGPLRQADDTLRLHNEGTLAVADEGRLVGLVRREKLAVAGEAPVVTVMEEAVSVKLDETIAEARELKPTFGPDPIPVTDHEEYLVGALTLPVA